MKNKVQERKLTGHGEVEQNNTGQRQKTESRNTQKVYWGREELWGKAAETLGKYKTRESKTEHRGKD